MFWLMAVIGGETGCIVGYVLAMHHLIKKDQRVAAEKARVAREQGQACAAEFKAYALRLFPDLDLDEH